MKILRITESKKSIGIPKTGAFLEFQAFTFLFFLLVCEAIFLMQVDIFLLCPQWFWKSRLQTFDLLYNANPFWWSVKRGCFSSYVFQIQQYRHAVASVITSAIRKSSNPGSPRFCELSRQSDTQSDCWVVWKGKNLDVILFSSSTALAPSSGSLVSKSLKPQGQ